MALLWYCELPLYQIHPIIIMESVILGPVNCGHDNTFRDKLHIAVFHRKTSDYR